MQSCERVVFISTINAELIDRAEAIRQLREDGIAHHVLNEVTGLLLYSDHYIFHCFESRHGEMNKLKRNVMAYPYHHNHKMIYEKIHVEPQFKSWSMVYALTENQVQDFIKKHQWPAFNPYLLEGELLDEFMQIIYSYSDRYEPVFLHSHERSINKQTGAGQDTEAKYKINMLIVIGLALIAGFILYGLDYFGLLPSSNSILH